jgi:hypothetical protein
MTCLLLLAVVLLASLGAAGLPRSALAMPSDREAVLGLVDDRACTGDPDDGEHKPHIQVDPENPQTSGRSHTVVQPSDAAPARRLTWLFWSWLRFQRALPVAPLPLAWLCAPHSHPAPGGSR